MVLHTSIGEPPIVGQVPDSNILLGGGGWDETVVHQFENVIRNSY